ncbi:MAG TPA: hypothetical protein VF807_13810 [Ktedonobacterales bacterium]
MKKIEAPHGRPSDRRGPPALSQLIEAPQPVIAPRLTPQLAPQASGPHMSIPSLPAIASASHASRLRATPGAGASTPAMAPSLTWHSPTATSASGASGTLEHMDEQVCPERVATVMRIHAVVTLGAALASASLALSGTNAALWAMVLAVLAGGGAFTAWYVSVQLRQPSLGVLALVGAQAGMLAWAMELIGPRAALLVIVPAVALLALHMAGREAALLAIIMCLTLYLAFVLVNLIQPMQPALTLTSPLFTLLDATLVSIGLTLSGISMSRLHNRWQHERFIRQALDLRLMRQHAASALALYQVEADAERLRWALSEGLRGGSVRVPVAEPVLGPVAAMVGLTTSRMVTLQHDREERIRLEGAIQRALVALRRYNSPLGLPLETRTALDELIAEMRKLGAAHWPGDPQPRDDGAASLVGQSACMGEPSAAQDDLFVELVD